MTQVAHPDFNVPVSYETAVLPDSPDAQVSSTIDLMRMYAQRDSGDPVFIESLRSFQQLNMIQDPCETAYRFAKSMMRFQRDEQTGYGFADDVIEVLIRPADVVRLATPDNRVPGDCDCFSMTVAAALLAMEVPCCFATVAASPSDPNIFSHVYVVAWPDDPEMRCPIDASHGPYCGWEVPNGTRYLEWPLHGGGFPVMCALGIAIASLGLLYLAGGIR